MATPNDHPPAYESLQFVERHREKQRWKFRLYWDREKKGLVLAYKKASDEDRTTRALSQVTLNSTRETQAAAQVTLTTAQETLVTMQETQAAMQVTNTATQENSKFMADTLSAMNTKESKKKT